MRIDRAKEICPELVLISGEDLTPYREASARIFSALCAFGPCQKLGLDELFVDVTDVAAQESGAAAGCWAESCNVHSAASGTCSAEAQSNTGTNYRPQDLRAAAGEGTVAVIGAAGASADSSDNAETASLRLLRSASHVATRCKQAVLEHSGLTVSVGVACSKLVAKLTSGLHKPDGLSALPQPEARAFLAPLDVRVLPGVGGAASSRLHDCGIRTVGDLASFPASRLQQALSRPPALSTLSAAKLYSMSIGCDAERVVQSGPPKSISVEDSFRGASTFDALRSVLCVLAPDLLRRLEADREAHGRRPRTMHVRLRHSGSRTMNNPSGALTGSSAVRSIAMPHLAGADAAKASLLVSASLTVLREVLKEGKFCLTLVGIGASNFEPAPRQGGGGSVSGRLAASFGSSSCNACSSSSSSSSLLAAAGPSMAATSPSRSPSSAAVASAAEAEAQRAWRVTYGGASSGQNGSSSSQQLGFPCFSKAEERRRREGGSGDAATSGVAPIAQAAGSTAGSGYGGDVGRLRNFLVDRDALQGAADGIMEADGWSEEELALDRGGWEDQEEDNQDELVAGEWAHTECEQGEWEQGEWEEHGHWHQADKCEGSVEAAEASATVSAATGVVAEACCCPICGVALDNDNERQNWHIDACLGGVPSQSSLPGLTRQSNARVAPPKGRAATSARGGKRRAGTHGSSSPADQRQRTLMSTWASKQS